mmetsp:Transcript_28709/g.77740  ORF Transcript_28709/g.77740 Transcript_28709/m.77740 type:complete len:1128 (-) Transcript_28709:2748-6131(-)
MSFNHRLPALATAVFSSAAVLTAAFAGASCSFLVRLSEDEELLSSTGSNSFGILCEHDFYPRDGDRMWELSRMFLIVGLTLGSVTAALAWAVVSFLTPTSVNWNGISVLAAITAVVQVPIFVIFEAEPCLGGDIEESESGGNFFYKTADMSCRLGSGSFILMASVLLYISVTLITQCLDKPRWGLELDIWKVHRRGASRPVSPSPRNDEYYYDDEENYADTVHLTGRGARNDHGDDGGDGDDDDYYRISRILPAGKAKRSYQDSSRKEPSKAFGFFARLFRFSSWDDDMEVPGVPTHSMSVDEEIDCENGVRVVPTVCGGKAWPVSSVKSAEGHEVIIPPYQKIEAEEGGRYQTLEEMVRSVQIYDAMGPTHVERHQLIDSPNASLISKESIVQPPVSSVSDILQDLEKEEICVQSKPVDVPVPEGVRKLSKKPKTDERKPRNTKKNLLRKGSLFSSRKAGYALIDDSESDYNETSDSEEQRPFHSDNYDAGDGHNTNINISQELESFANSVDFIPQIFVDSDSSQEANKHMGISSDQDDLDEDRDISQLASSEDWHGNFPDGDKSQKHSNKPFDCISIGSTHSDPGPFSFNDSREEFFDFSHSIIFTGGDDNDQISSFDDIFKLSTEDDIQWESDFASESLYVTDDDSQLDTTEAQEQRGRPNGRNDGRRRRRPISPVGSIKSNGSLLHTTINEETEEDVKKELGLNASYSIKRTLSCPEQRAFNGPITTRKEKSTKELLKKLEQLKRTIDTEIDPNSSIPDSDRGYVLSPGGAKQNRNLPPLSPREATTDSKNSEETGTEGPETLSPRTDDPSQIVSEAIQGEPLRESMSPTKEVIEAPVEESITPRNDNQYDEGSTGTGSSPSKPVGESITPSNDNQYAQASTGTGSPPSKPWKESDSNPPPTDRENWKNSIFAYKNTSTDDNALDISDDTSETGCTHSTISDSDGSAGSVGETGPRHIRSKSVGRGVRRSKIRHLRASSSLSPTRSTVMLDDNKRCSTSLSNLARESRIRRLQRRKGYLPLGNDTARATSPTPRDPYSTDDLELTPKRKTVERSSTQERNDDENSQKSVERNSDFTNDIFQPTLMDPNQSCPEFDNILDQLDLQLIDLRRPVGAEYGDDEESL